MKAYTFIFLLGSAHLIIPFLGISFIYKQYIITALAIVTIMYAILLRAIAKEKENIKLHTAGSQTKSNSVEKKQKTIDEVIEMKEEEPEKRVSEVLPKKRIQKPKVLAKTSSRYDE